MTDRRSAVVTGTSKGIGRAIARSLTDAGWIVVGLERSAGSDTVVSGAAVEVVVGDASDLHSHLRAAAAATGHAPLGGWVNNAGITKQTPLHELDPVVMREVIETNGFGYLYGASAAVRTFVAQRSGGAIVHVGSIHGRASHPNHAAYEFTKGGIDALARSIAVTYGPFGIRSNTIAPGGVRTPHLEAQFARATDPVAEERALTDGPPARRIATPEEIGALAAFLLGDGAAYISGESIAVDGGWTAAFGAPPTIADLAAHYGSATHPAEGV